MTSSDWLRYSRSILWYIVSSVARRAPGATFLCFQSVCKKDLDESFERIVDLYLNN